MRAPSGAQCLVQLSDIHLMADAHGLVHGDDADDGLIRALGALRDAGIEPDAWVLSGDLAEDGAPEAYARLREYVEPYGVPVQAVAGNHDDPAALAAVFGPPDTLELGPWRVVALDTSRPMRIDGEVDLGEAATLLDSVGDQPIVLVLHHPPISISTNPWFQLAGATELLDALAERPNVRALLTGHLHCAYERDLPSGAIQLAGPSSLVSISHDGDSYGIGTGGPTGARVLHLADDGTWSQQLVVS